MNRGFKTKLGPVVILITVTSALILMAHPFSLVQGQTDELQVPSDAYSASYETYKALHQAEVNGANITSLIPEFNSALNKLSGNEENETMVNQATSMFHEVSADAQSLGSKAATQRSDKVTTVVLYGILTIALATVGSFCILITIRAHQWRKLMSSEVRLVEAND